METKSEYLEITAAQDGGGKYKVAGLAYGKREGPSRLQGGARCTPVPVSD